LVPTIDFRSSLTENAELQRQFAVDRSGEQIVCNVLRVCLEARVHETPSLADSVARLVPEVATGIHNAVGGQQVKAAETRTGDCVFVIACARLVARCESRLASTSNESDYSLNRIQQINEQFFVFTPICRRKTGVCAKRRSQVSSDRRQVRKACYRSRFV
jgi:hypothetical protein